MRQSPSPVLVPALFHPIRPFLSSAVQSRNLLASRAQLAAADAPKMQPRDGKRGGGWTSETNVGVSGKHILFFWIVPTSAMCKLLRSSVLIGLMALILSAGHCKEKSESSVGLKEKQNLLNLIMEIIQELKKYHLEEDEENGVQYKQDYPPLDQREMPDYGTYSEEQKVEIFPRDLRMKDKFLNHLTGHLYFGPKCTKHFHRLYHHTRDCTIPAYYKRCARLLTRLAVSPMCTEG